MKKFDLMKSIVENSGEIPMVWGDTQFHKMPQPVHTSYSEDEESAKNPNQQTKPTDEKEPDHTEPESKTASEKEPVQPDAPKKKEDPSRQGVIRKVEGAHLVYKKKNQSGTFDELWMFPYKDSFISGNLKKTVEIKRAILAGTDIPVKDNTSPDGSQTYEQKIVGNAQFVFIRGITQ